jgi:hypothetical protein
MGRIRETLYEREHGPVKGAGVTPLTTGEDTGFLKLTEVYTEAVNCQAITDGSTVLEASWQRTGRAPENRFAACKFVCKSSGVSGNIAPHWFLDCALRK